MPQRPWFPFHASDWLGDRGLRSCSLAARGLWTDCLCLMHDANPRGHLLLKGSPPDPEALALMVGRPTREVRAALEELEAAGVLSRTDDGVVFSRRMVRDTLRQDRAVANGSKGGNPSLRPQVNQETAGRVKGQDNDSPNTPHKLPLVSGVSGFGPLRRHPLDTVDGIVPTVEISERANEWLRRFALALERHTGVKHPSRPDRDFHYAKTLVATYSDVQLDALVEIYLVATGPRFDGQPKSPGRLADVAGLIAERIKKEGRWPSAS